MHNYRGRARNEPSFFVKTLAIGMEFLCAVALWSLLFYALIEWALG